MSLIGRRGRVSCLPIKSGKPPFPLYLRHFEPKA
jgi:hypothetical protein